MNLHTLKPVKGSRKVKRIIGRGDGSGRGKCSGYGHKGAKARSGRGKGYGSGYEGGQTRSYLRIPKIRGWRNKLIRPLRVAEVQLENLNSIPAGTDVTIAVLREYGLAKKTDHIYKILGGTEINVALNFKKAKATKTAVSAIKKAGGSVELTPNKNEKPDKRNKKPEPKKSIDNTKTENTEQGE